MSIAKYIPGVCLALALGLGGLSACGVWPDNGNGVSGMQRFVIGAPGAFRLPVDDVLPPVFSEASGRSVRPLATPVPAPSTSPSPSPSPRTGGGSGGGGGVTVRPASPDAFPPTDDSGSAMALVEEALPGLQLGVDVSPGGFADPLASVSAEVLEVAP